MAMHLELINPDEVFESLNFRPIILNDQNQDFASNREELKRLATTLYGEDSISLTGHPSCGCGPQTGSLNLGSKCDVCGQRVDYDHTRPLQSTLWIRAPEGVVGMFTPIAWYLLSDVMSTTTPQKWNGLEWICKTDTKNPDHNNKRGNVIVDAFKRVGLKRGLNNVLTNIPGLLEAVSLIGRSYPSVNIARTVELLSATRDKVVCNYLPIPDKIAFVIENTPMGEFSDGSIRHAMDAIYTVARIRDTGNVTRISNRIVTALASLSEYYNVVLKDVIASKSGWLRKAVYGSRLFFTYRATITSITDQHHYEDIHIPYPQAVVLFRLHLLNRLINIHGQSHKQAYEYLEYHSVKVDPFILQELNTLIKNARGGKGFATTLTRYPSLDPASTQRLNIVGISEMAIKISIMILRGPNADKSLSA